MSGDVAANWVLPGLHGRWGWLPGMAASGFSAPGWFGLLVLNGAVIAGYVWAQRRARRHLLRFANLELLERIAPHRPGWPRHIPAVLLILGLLLLTLGLAGSTANAQVPRNRATVMLVIDVSLSMNSTDVSPTRLAAAQDAAISFVHHLTPASAPSKP
ncbi:MAG: VWA domain-containing protein [Candidatus Dormibacteria bacterium]